MALVSDLYTPQIAAARARLERDPGLMNMLDPKVDPKTFERFLIQFSASGVYMTTPVESWIRRAGERCVAMGLQEIGESLQQHAHHEAGHQSMMIDDTKKLVSRWNEKHADKLSADDLLAAPPLEATKRYVDIHERTIASDAPFCQVAIELEIEQMSVVLGPKLLAQVERVLGKQAVEGMSFLDEHVKLDVGHTHLNQRMLEMCLAARPDAAPRLAKTGGDALGIYVDFLGECFAVASRAVGPRAAA